MLQKVIKQNIFVFNWWEIDWSDQHISNDKNNLRVYKTIKVKRKFFIKTKFKIKNFKINCFWKDHGSRSKARCICHNFSSIIKKFICTDAKIIWLWHLSLYNDYDMQNKIRIFLLIFYQLIDNNCLKRLYSKSHPALNA